MKGNNGGGSKFLPGGGKGGNNNSNEQSGKNPNSTHSQTQRQMHTNQSHMGGSHGGK
jgi:hypothetical protein